MRLDDRGSRVFSIGGGAIAVLHNASKHGHHLEPVNRFFNLHDLAQVRGA
jgi:hypothetical protein